MQENLFDEEAFDCRVICVPAGEFINEEGKHIIYSNRIKIIVNKQALKLTALQALAMSKMFQSNEFTSVAKTWAKMEITEKQNEIDNIDI